jgi:hypothetical protein
MKTPRKKLTNKDFVNRTNILMMEVENIKRTQDSMFMTIVDYIEYKGEIENLKKYMANKYKEKDDVQTELQKSGS